MKKLLTSRTLAILAVAALTVSLVPLLVLGFYNHPCADDYNYGLYAAQAVRAGGSPLEVLAAAGRKTAETYQNWQGTFSAIFLMALHPAVFGEQWYVITPFLMLGSLVFSTFFFLKCLCVQRLGMERSHWVILSCCLCFFCVQFAPSAFEGFYWYNASLFYTFFYGVCLCCYGLLLKFLYAEKRRSAILELSGAAFLSIVIGGGNYPAALLSFLLLAAALVFSIGKRLPLSRRLGTALCLVLEGTAFLISVFAPGNAVRQGKFDSHPGAVEAVCKALLSSVQKVMEYTTLPFLLGLLLLAPILYRCASGVKFSFPCPLLAPLAVVCILGVEMTPPLYAMTSLGAQRIHDLYYYTYCLLMTAALFYLCGWLSHRYSVLKVSEKGKDRFPGFALGVAALLFALLLFSPGFGSINCVSAAVSVKNGVAQEYDRQMRARLALYLDPAVKDVVMEPLTMRPPLFASWSPGTTDDPENVTNQRLAKFYDKNSVRERSAEP